MNLTCPALGAITRTTGRLAVNFAPLPSKSNADRPISNGFSVVVEHLTFYLSNICHNEPHLAVSSLGTMTGTSGMSSHVSAPHLVQIRWIWTNFRTICVSLLFLTGLSLRACQAEACRRPTARSANTPLLLASGCCVDFSCGSPPPAGNIDTESVREVMQ
jgi:hypothetical protein